MTECPEQKNLIAFVDLSSKPSSILVRDPKHSDTIGAYDNDSGVEGRRGHRRPSSSSLTRCMALTEGSVCSEAECSWEKLEESHRDFGFVNNHSIIVVCEVPLQNRFDDIC